MKRRSWFSTIGAFAGLCALVSMIGCSGVSNRVGGSSIQTLTTYAYVSENGTSNAIAQFRVASDGTLAPLTPATVDVTTVGGPAWIIADPSGNYLFAASLVSPPVIDQFVISADGTVAPNSVPSLSGGDSFYPFIFTADGKYAIVPFTTNNTVSVYSLGVSGSLELGQTYVANQFPISAATDPSGKYVYIGCVGNGYGTIYEYSIGADGTLSPLSTASTPSASEVENVGVSATGFLYAVNYNGTVTAFHIDETTGILTNAGTYPTGIGASSQPDWIAFDPTGKYAYVSNKFDNSVSQFVINPTTGELSMNGFDVATGLWPFQVALDPSGKFVYVPAFDGSISMFTISSNGTLTPNGSLALGAQNQVIPYAITFAQR